MAAWSGHDGTGTWQVEQLVLDVPQLSVPRPGFSSLNSAQTLAQDFPGSTVCAWVWVLGEDAGVYQQLRGRIP